MALAAARRGLECQPSVRMSDFWGGWGLRPRPREFVQDEGIVHGPDQHGPSETRCLADERTMRMGAVVLPSTVLVTLGVRLVCAAGATILMAVLAAGGHGTVRPSLRRGLMVHRAVAGLPHDRLDQARQEDEQGEERLKSLARRAGRHHRQMIP
jgi:hypothetical protein